MKRPTMPYVVLAAVILTALWCVWVRWDWLPPLSYVETQMDINSGDVRDRIYIFGVSVTRKVDETPLSREVRRLGIAIPEAPEWQFMNGHSSGGVFSDGWLGSAWAACCGLVSLLDRTRTPDEDRRVVLQKVLKILKTGSPFDARTEIMLLIDDVAEKNAVEVFEPYMRDELRKRRASKEQADVNNAL
jgi:hypothetical protein